MKEKSNNIFITGVSTGIGMGCARELLKRGYKVIGSVRSEADAQKLSKLFGPEFIPVVFDVTDEEAVKKSAAEIEKKLKGDGLAYLINNVGIAVGGPLVDMDMAIIRQHFEVNVMGLLHVTKAFLPLLGARPDHSVRPGKILNISSVAGKIGVPFLGAYAGSKFAVEGLSESLRRELQWYGIDVVVAGPGNVITPIWEKSVNTDVYKQSVFYKTYEKFFQYMVHESKNGYTVDEIGGKIADIVEKQKPAVRYALVKERMKDWTIPRLLPARMLDKIFGKNIGLLHDKKLDR